MQIDKLHWIGLGSWCTIVAAAMVACGGGGGDGGGMAPQSATLRVGLTDAPGCNFDHIWIQVEKVRIHTSASAGEGDAGWTEVVLSPPRRIDLLTLTNGVLADLGSTPLPAGHYSQVRLVLSSTTSGANPPENAAQPTGGAIVPLTTPSGQQSGIKLPVNMDVAAGELVDLVIDMQACPSVVRAGNSGQYLLKPVVSVVPKTVTGITGSVAPALNMGTMTVSAQQNGTTVRSTTPDATGKFNLPYLAPGNYTLVITSDAHAAAVITNVPAGSANTVVGTTPITLPDSAMADVSGTVAAGSTPVTDAKVRATQALTGGPTIEVIPLRPVDAALGTYQFKVPQAAPVVAAYSTSTLSFTPAADVAGKYTVEAQAPGRTTSTKPADVTSTPAVQVNFAY